jgi:hypothetical protein
MAKAVGRLLKMVVTSFPLTTRQAIVLDQILKALPKDDAFRNRKCIIHQAPSEVLPGDRVAVSWISTESVDRVGDVLIAKGTHDSQYKLNPIVTLEHNYAMPPVGKSLWRKVSADGQRYGIKAKTHYPARPSHWPEGKDWPADVALCLVQAGWFEANLWAFIALFLDSAFPGVLACGRLLGSDDSPNLTCGNVSLFGFGVDRSQNYLCFRLDMIDERLNSGV